MDNKETGKKLYSKRAISISTFLGGPLAAAILIGQNFKALGKNELRINAIFIGIISTVLIIAGLTIPPQEVIDKIPSFLIPAIYTSIIYWVVNKYQGAQLDEHEQNNGLFHSGWKAAGIAVIGGLVLFGGVIAGIFFTHEEFDSAQYDLYIEEFVKNESEALTLYKIYESSEKTEIVDFIETVGIPKWKENLKLIDKMDNMANLPDELENQHPILIEYCNLQYKSFSLIKTRTIEDTHDYDEQINAIADEIDEVLNQL